MAVAFTLGCKPNGMKTRRSSGNLRRVCHLLLCLAAIWLFMFQVGPWLEKSSMIQPMVDFIEERDIAANMYFYTEVEEFSEANINMDNTMKYMPGARP